MFLHLDDFEKLCKIMDYRFKDPKLLAQAITRRSATINSKSEISLEHNEAFATMGDGLLRAIIEDILIELNPKFTKDPLSITRDQLVNNNVQTKIASHLKLGQFLVMGAKEEKNKGRDNPKILADALEAIISAIFLDSDRNYLCAKHFVVIHWGLQHYYNDFLAQAVHKKDIKKVNYFLQCGADSNCDTSLLVDFDNYSFDRIVAVSPIPEKNKNQEGLPITLLLHAASFDEIAIAECLLKYDADVNRSDALLGMTPLYHAACRGNVAMAKLLHSYNALFIPIFCDGYTALHIAAHYKHHEMVEYLAGEIPDIDTQDMFGRTALYIAARYGHGI